MGNELENGDALSALLLTMAPEMISGLISISGLFVIFWASVEIYKQQRFSWRKVLLISLITSAVIEIAIMVAEAYLDWEVFVYIKAIGVLLSSALFLVAAISFMKFVNYAKNT